MIAFKMGDLVKLEGGVYKVCGFTRNCLVIPDGWLIVDEVGSTLNPKHCELYAGAKSVLSAHLRNDNAPI